MSPISRFFSALVAGLAAAAGAQAQRSLLDGPTSDRVSLRAELGFGGLYRAHHWAPITVTVSGGRRAFNGTVVVTYQQDPTQSARILANFAATPGREVPVPIVAAFPEHLDRLKIEVLSERGRSVADLTLSATSFNDPSELLQAAIGPSQAIVLSLGPVSFESAAAHWKREAGPEPDPVVSEDGMTVSPPPVSELRRLGSLLNVAPDPAQLPRAWAAYDSVLAVIATAPVATEMDGRSLEAIRTWVRSGGMLVLLADAPGPEWRSWFPASPLGDLIEIGPPTAGPVPPEAAAVLATNGFEAAAEAPHRPIRLTERGAAMGWRLAWATGEGEGLLASGPVGHGLAVVLGTDPARAPAQVSGAAGASLWRSATRPALERWLERTDRTRAPNAWVFESQNLRQRAVVAAVDAVATPPQFGIGVFVMLGLGGLLLAVMLGPGDAYILGKVNLRHRSWLTALGWIGAFSVIAYVLPLVSRTGPSRLGRFRIIDTIADAEGKAVSAWQSACTGIFASRAGVVPLSGVAEDSWWHGVSPIGFLSPRAGGSSRPLVSRQQPGLAPGSPIPALHASIWTFRTLQDESSPAPAPAARLSRAGDLWRVEVIGLPEGARVLDAGLRIGDLWETLTDPQRDREAFVWDAAAPRSGTPSPWLAGEGGVLNLQGADRRAAAVEWLLDRGWGAVYLRVAGLSPDVSMPGPVEESHAGVLRLLAPLEGAP